MVKFWPSALAAVVAILTAFSGQIQGYIAAHPAVAAGLAGAGVIVAHLAKSPTQQ